MHKSHALRFIAVAALAVAWPVLAVEYKCKDASGKWSEQACPDYEQRKATERADAKREAAKNRDPEIGMTKAEFLGLNWAYGSPKRVMTTNEGRHSHEQWELPCQFFYFDDEILTAKQNTCGY